MANNPKAPVTAFVLMKIAAGEAQHTIQSLKSWSTPQGGSSAHVKGAWVIAGEYDGIAMLEANNNKDLLQLVTNIVGGSHHSATVIISTVTMFAEDSFW